MLDFTHVLPNTGAVDDVVAETHALLQSLRGRRVWAPLPPLPAPPLSVVACGDSSEARASTGAGAAVAAVAVASTGAGADDDARRAASDAAKQRVLKKPSILAEQAQAQRLEPVDVDEANVVGFEVMQFPKKDGKLGFSFVKEKYVVNRIDPCALTLPGSTQAFDHILTDSLRNGRCLRKRRSST